MLADEPGTDAGLKDGEAARFTGFRIPLSAIGVTILDPG